ncbi:hypothetical protein OUZ56_017675 [Daphnia magna]|uniref:Uncharacterized protein n=1 Tax=Daphnia magna TaxID=35525 RepID=A0ABR0ATF2_9CRUS|nr:hypothetical protein OUZ56_017675 [Daphnia magna]
MKISLPPGWALTPALQAGEMWRDYQEVRVVVAVQENEVWLFIHLPMLEFLRALTLYRVISLSRATQKSTRGMQCEGLPAYLVVSSDREMFVKINAEIAGQCCSPGQALCPIKQAMNRKKPEVCAASRFSWQKKGACKYTLPQRLPPGAGRMPSTLSIAAVTIYKVLMSCTAQSEDWLFQASFWKEYIWINLDAARNMYNTWANASESLVFRGVE